MALTWNEIDWELLESLRARFLAEDQLGGGDYWKSEKELAHYDLAFAPRIGWKWDAVLAEARARGWRPPTGARLLDWGCGTGIATRRFVQSWGSEAFPGALCWDRSPRAREFAVRAIGEAGLPAEPRSVPTPPPAPYLLLVSHVVNELSDLSAVLACARGAEAIFWVEPGTPAASRRLIEVRESLREAFRFVAPCPHQERCGLSGDRRPNDWCHHFAAPPPEVFQSAEWEKFSRRLGVDRRSLPTSFLVMSRTAPAPAPGARVIGRPRVYKGYAKALVCRPDVLDELTLRRKDMPQTFRDLDGLRFTRFLMLK